MTRVLIVDDDLVQLRLTAEVATQAGFAAVTATGGRQALELLRADRGIVALVLDLVMPDLDGMAVLDAMRREGLTTPVIVQTGHSGLDTVGSAMRNGAFDFFVKPVAPERLVVSLRNALRLGQLEILLRGERHRHRGTLALGDIVAHAPAMERVATLTARAARSTLPVLVEGEAGTGRELIARIIHGSGERAGRPFVTLRCGTLPPDELDTMLFGRPGAALGAALAGKVAEAHGGTLYIDEVAELPADTQGRLLRLIETGEIAAEGAGRPMRANVRVIASTSRRLLNLAKAGQCREDLYYRLNVFPVYLPPLRDRPEDIAPLVRHFIGRLAAELGRRVDGITEPALALLSAYDWPGNVRQLETAIYRAVALSEDPLLGPQDFPQVAACSLGRPEALRLVGGAEMPSAPVHIDDASLVRREETRSGTVPDRFIGRDGEVAALADIERELIVFALRHHGYRMSRVARALGIGRSTLYRKLREYGLDEGMESDAA